MKPLRIGTDDFAEIADWNHVHHRDLYLWLKKHIPVIGKKWPLAIGFRQELLELLPKPESPEAFEKTLRKALHLHCKQEKYHAAVLYGTDRYHINGETAGEISDKDREFSKRIYHKKKIRRKRKLVHQANRQRKLEKAAAAEIEEQAGFHYPVRDIEPEKQKRQQEQKNRQVTVTIKKRRRVVIPS